MKTLLPVVAMLSLAACEVSTSSSSSSSARGAPIGAACSTDGECAGSAICGTNWPGGYCLMTCTGAASVCPTNSLCTRLTGLNDSYCFDTCSTDRDCRGGYVCNPVNGSNKGVCLPN
jgi:hypothetical protein